MRAALPVNRSLSAANSALYGVCHAAVLHLGCGPGPGFVHTGHQLSFVYDIADLYKAEIAIPAAFAVAAEAEDDHGPRSRRAVRDAIVEARLLARMAADVKALLGISAGADAPAAAGTAQLWDGAGTVPGGVGYGDDEQ